jgi:hypothetical protein
MADKESVQRIHPILGELSHSPPIEKKPLKSLSTITIIGSSPAAPSFQHIESEARAQPIITEGDLVPSQ